MAIDYAALLAKLTAALAWAQQYAPQFAEAIKALIAIFSTPPAPFNVVKAVKAGCGTALLDALHASAYHQSEALAQTFIAMHEAACQCCDQPV